MPNATDQLIATIEQIMQDTLETMDPDFEWIYDKLDDALTIEEHCFGAFIDKVQEILDDIGSILYRLPKYQWVYDTLDDARRLHPFKHVYPEHLLVNDADIETHA
jgi:hypothetical protein